MKRVCLDRNDTIVTVSWIAKSDGCGYFQKYIIYQQENADPYQILTEITDINIDEYSFQTTNLNANKRFFIGSAYSCNGVDTLFSDTVSIDQDPPVLISLDSVSFILGTSDIRLGWTPNPSPDTRGYNTYTDAGTAFNRIGTTEETSFVHNPGNNQPRYTMASFDSCFLTTAIAQPTHKSTYITAEYDSCLRRFTINWTLYEGWSAISKQDLFVSINNDQYILNSSFNGTQQTHTIQDITIGNRYSFFIRSWNDDQSISSTSNQVTIQTFIFNDTIPNNMINVSVVEEEIALTMNHHFTSHISSINLYKFVDYQNKRQINNYAPENLNSDQIVSFIDNNVDVEDHIYSYQIETINVCNETVFESNQINSILLKINDNILNFNNIRTYLGITSHYEIDVSYDDGSTWKNYNIVNDTFPIKISDTNSCFRVTGFETENPLYDNQHSKSNIACIAGPFWVEVPNAIKAFGAQENNKVFKVLGGGINHNLSYYEIFNRWGQRIHRSSTNDIWKPNDIDKMTGQYVYIVRVIGIKGETKTMKGLLTIVN